MTYWQTIARQDLNIDNPLSLLSADIFTISDWIFDVFERMTFEPARSDLHVHRVRVSDLGFDEATTLDSIYAAANANGYGLLPPVASLYLRLKYQDQPKGEWLRIAVPFKSMIDSDGVAHLPKLGAALNRLYIETYWAYPSAVFHPHNEIVFSSEVKS